MLMNMTGSHGATQELFITYDFVNSFFIFVFGFASSFIFLYFLSKIRGKND